MQADVEVDVSEVVRELSEYGKRAGNVQSVAAQVADMLVSAIEDKVESEGGGAWPPPAASTLSRAKRKGYRKGKGFGKLLQDTGHMVGDVVPSHDATTATATSPASYALVHADGAPAANVPQRDFLDVVDDEFMAEVADLLLREVVQ